MVSRIVDCNIRAENLDQFKTTLANRFLPQIKSQPGFVDLVESIDLETGHFVCMTLWKSKEDVARYDAGLFQEVADTLGPLMKEAPSVHTMSVENAPAHNVEEGQERTRATAA